MKTKNQTGHGFSVVIPTLGGETLRRTIDMVNTGSLVPDEILICIPKDFTSRVAGLSDIDNVKIIGTESKGQVLQRIEGFKQVTNEYVIQLDDDMYVYDTCFEKLMEGITSMKGDVAIAPAMVFEPGKASCYDMVNVDSKMSTWIHGRDWFKPGNITRTGKNIGLNALGMKERYHKVEWLPGGCVVHRKQNLILADFFPFRGKAFYEDVIQSIYLARKGVIFYIDGSAVCGIDPYEETVLPKWNAVHEFHKHFPYRKHIVRLRGQSLSYLFLDGLYTYYFTARGIFTNFIRSLFPRLRNNKQEHS